MNTVTIRIGDDDLKVIDRIFENESAFDPRTQEDRVLIEVMKQVQNNPKVYIEEYDIDMDNTIAEFISSDMTNIYFELKELNRLKRLELKMILEQSGITGGLYDHFVGEVEKNE